eukprot:scaffold284833_cov20-Prasinocladus_malaysianus.AAC.1
MLRKFCFQDGTATRHISYDTQYFIQVNAPRDSCYVEQDRGGAVLRHQHWGWLWAQSLKLGHLRWGCWLTKLADSIATVASSLQAAGEARDSDARQRRVQTRQGGLHSRHAQKAGPPGLRLRLDAKADKRREQRRVGRDWAG